jgi:hypothetical protein
MLLQDRLLKSCSVSMPHNAAYGFTTFILNCFAKFNPYHVVPVCGNDTHHVAMISFLHLNSLVCVDIINSFHCFFISVMVCSS